MISEVAKKEKLDERRLKSGVESGRVVILRNAGRDIDPVAVGEGTHIKVNANLGTSPDRVDLAAELEKARVAVESGTDTIMDLSVGGDLDEVRQRIIAEVDVPLGTVPIYQAFVEKRLDLDKEDILRVVERHCRDGVDFVTLHCGLTRDLVDLSGRRLIPVTSRGGSFLAAWMIRNQQENPLYEFFDEFLEVLKEYSVAVSLGDAMRPACLHDASDELQFRELFNMGRLTRRAWDAGVSVIVEGPGHVPLDEVGWNVGLAKRVCGGAPFYVLGPLVTDIGMGYDHITGAIGGAVAGMYGADFLCYVTPAEHLGLPDAEDVRLGVFSSKIAAHAADVVRLRGLGAADAGDMDDVFSKARSVLDWESMFDLAIDGNLREVYSDLVDKGECTMCGEYCALKIVKRYLGERKEKKG